jgi:cellulose synthase/poly-beta-1,6-N-acetylglucosamine synthase-like glycosyltransferase
VCLPRSGARWDRGEVWTRSWSPPKQGEVAISGVWIVNAIVGSFAALLLVPVVIVCAEIAASLLPWRRIRLDARRPRPRLAVLIPAHDEAAGIERTLASIRPQLAAGDRLLVVADNCSDATAELSRLAGAEVIERADAQLRGKGYALDCGVRHLSHAPPEVLVLLDADVTVREGSIDALARQAQQTGAPAQGVYLLREATGACGRDLVSHLAFIVRNQARPLGLARVGGPCPLFGAGMAFPWETIRSAPLASSNIVEDMALGLDLAAAGRAPLLCTGAFIDGALPHAPAIASTQRRRWEHGHLRTIITHVPRTFIAGLLKGRPHAMLLAADLCVPPLSFHLMLLLGSGTLLLIVALLTPASAWPGVSLLLGAVLLAIALLTAWFRFSPRGVALRALCCVPSYVGRKVPMYLAAFGQGEREWKRTVREPATAAEPPTT